MSARIPEPETAADGTVLLEDEVPASLTWSGEPHGVQVVAMPGLAEGIRIYVVRRDGHRFDTLNCVSLVRLLLNRVRAAEARVAELEAAAARLNAAREAGEVGR